MGWLNIITAPKSTGILDIPKARASGVPMSCSRSTATSAAMSQPSRGTPEYWALILLTNDLKLLLLADIELPITVMSIPHLLRILACLIV
jgi:hypothetical protein